MRLRRNVSRSAWHRGDQVGPITRTAWKPAPVREPPLLEHLGDARWNSSSGSTSGRVSHRSSRPRAIASKIGSAVSQSPQRTTATRDGSPWLRPTEAEDVETVLVAGSEADQDQGRHAAAVGDAASAASTVAGLVEDLDPVVVAVARAQARPRAGPAPARRGSRRAGPGGGPPPGCPRQGSWVSRHDGARQPQPGGAGERDPGGSRDERRHRGPALEVAAVEGDGEELGGAEGEVAGTRRARAVARPRGRRARRPPRRRGATRR